MNTSLLVFENEVLRQKYSEFVQNYRDKLDAVTALQFAVSNADSEGEINAKIAINNAGKEATRLAQELLNTIRDKIDPEELREIMRESGEASARAMESDKK